MSWIIKDMPPTMSPVLQATFSQSEGFFAEFYVVSDSCADNLYVNSTCQWHILKSHLPENV